MPKAFSFWISCAPYLQSVLRIVAAFIFIQAGAMKLFAWPIGMPPDNSTASLLSQVGIAGVLEVFGGGLVLILFFFLRVTHFSSFRGHEFYLQGLRFQ